MLRPVLSDEVAGAVADGRPVVAMESTIYSHLGLPSPHNAEALDRCEAAIRAAIEGAGISGVAPSRRVITGVEPLTGNQGR